MYNILPKTIHEQPLSPETSSAIFSAAVNLLRYAEPSETSTEVIGLDFGRYREGHLDAKIRLAGDVALLGTYLRYHQKDRIVETKLGADNKWDSGITSRKNITNWFCSICPFDVDADPIRRLASNDETFSNGQLVQSIADIIASFPKENVRTDSVFYNQNPEIYEVTDDIAGDGKVRIDNGLYRIGGTESKLEIVELNRLPVKVRYSISTPYEHDGIETSMILDVTIGALGKGALSCHFYNPVGGRRHNITPKDICQLEREIIEDVEAMAADKLSIAKQL
ncbi:hypothetical protein TM7x_02805 [Candidatus Nanosynbacter lyticus]|uniref:Uncharacterized protein n=1 Tax=Candidatus Nanosynbacter lyticus TaxID=2093824 RepID=A0A6S4GRC9_9BACT|nr:hypothetical protein [Candidatus Nanosynbacter lyticus]AJA06879.1 hypothetical protein TM7x_02805 [Candidatus Nanosynbacter lyticus]QCT41684.1 hypothetical protein FBF38_02775 [TM7 phylum sp. oral taxon 952]